MDIADLLPQFQEACSNGDFAVLDPFGRETDLVLAIAGPYSRAHTNAKHQLQNAITAASQGLGHKTKPIPAEEMEKLEDEYLAAHVVGWHGLTDKGAPVIRTDDEALRLLRRAPWIRAQVAKIVADEKAFMQHLLKKTFIPPEVRAAQVLGIPAGDIIDADN